MHKNLILAFGITILFLGLAIQPSVATVQPESIDVEYFDVTTELIGLGKEHTVQLTQQQMDELDALFESIKLQLDNAETEEETARIYNEVIVELDSYSLLGDCSVKQVQKLITGNFLKTRTKGLKDKLYDKNQFMSRNFFCLIAGKTTNTRFIPMSLMWLYRLDFLLENFQLLLFFLVFISLGAFVISDMIPFSLGNGIAFGYYSSWSYREYPAKGWIHILGLLGYINWEGELYGQIFPDSYIGVTGFTGIKIEDTSSSSYNEYFYLGFATSADVG
jgi:hypothetical protein